MYRELKALLEAKTQNGEDEQELVDGALLAIHEFVGEAFGDDARLSDEFKRLTNILVNGQ